MGLILQWNPLKTPQWGLEMNRISYSQSTFGCPRNLCFPNFVGELLLRPHFRLESPVQNALHAA